MDKPKRKLVVGEVFIAPLANSFINLLWADNVVFRSCVFLGFNGVGGSNSHTRNCHCLPFVRERTIDCGPELLGRRN